MNTNVLVVTSLGSHGQTVTATSGNSTVRSTFDAFRKARLRLTPGTWVIRHGHTRAKIEMPGHDISHGYTKLIREDADYLEWLEMPTDSKIAAIREKHPLARWAARVGAP